MPAVLRSGRLDVDVTAKSFVRTQVDSKCAALVSIESEPAKRAPGVSLERGSPHDRADVLLRFDDWSSFDFFLDMLNGLRSRARPGGESLVEAQERGE